ncbi:MAG: hypothetical protein MUC96_05740 [Myxococcaceae bacterium]|nr:hypothetical protein [Myxococcaceae bacterium]
MGGSVAVEGVLVTYLKALVDAGVGVAVDVFKDGQLIDSFLYAKLRG